MKKLSLSSYTRRYLTAVSILVGLAVGRYLLLEREIRREAFVGRLDPHALSQLGMWLLVLTIVGLGLVTFFIFRPMTRRILDEMAELNETRLKLSAEENLRREENVFRRLLESAPDAIVIVDAEGRIRLANSRADKMFGYSREELIGQHIEILIPGQFREKHVHYRREYTHNPRMRPMGLGMELVGLRKDGTEFPVEVSLSPSHSEGDVTVTAVIRDVTESRMRDRLATIGQLSGNIAHELRNPLATIDSSAYFLQRKLAEVDPKVAEHLARIKAGVVTATGVIESLLDLTRMKTPQMRPINLVEVVAEAITLSKSRPEMEIVRDFDVVEVHAQGDHHQLRMVFSNIINNAVDAITGRGKLTISIRPGDDESTEVIFHDTGPGIDPKYIEHIFTPLFSTKATGIGFGLSIAKMIVERHRGTITVNSSPAEGTTFVVRLPLSLA